MAFIGTPLDTRNTFQSLVGKRFNGDGSTTAFTLDVAPSSTLDIEVFVGNVRQDPNSAYTLSGTTLTFTGAPPSGTNNIYVVHQAKAVGTIGIPDDTISARTLVTLDNSADHVLIEDATDGALKKALIPGASFAGIDDQSSSNDDQLTITDTAVVINEDSDDVDFRVESNGNANMLFVSGGNDVVGVGAEGDLGVGLHIKSADSGVSSVDSAADELIIEGVEDSGLSIITPNDHFGIIRFGDPDDNDVGAIEYSHSSNFMRFYVNASERMRITSDGDLNFAQGQLQLLADNSAATSTAKWDRGAGQGGNTSTALQFCHGGSVKGSIGYDDGSTSYNTSSDYRLKENAVAISDGITRLKTLKPYRFNFKTNTDKTIDGFFAHEVTAVPEAITGEKDAVDSDNNPIHQGIDQSKLVPLLTAALKEAITKIETLETEMTALKARVTTLEG